MTAPQNDHVNSYTSQIAEILNAMSERALRITGYEIPDATATNEICAVSDLVLAGGRDGKRSLDEEMVRGAYNDLKQIRDRAMGAELALDADDLAFEMQNIRMAASGAMDEIWQAFTQFVSAETAAAYLVEEQ